MKLKQLAVFNLLSTMLLIIWNWLAQGKVINNVDVGELSAKYNSLFTPASYAFSIWGIIFLGLLLFGIHQVKTAFQDRPSPSVQQSGYWFIVANILCGLWVLVWVNEFLILSLICMIGILISLLIIVVKLKINREKVSVIEYWLVTVPVSLYVGWITIATVANFGSVLNHYNFSFGYEQETWVLIMIVIASMINLFMLSNRNMRVYALVAIWAFIAIYVRHENNDNHIAIWAAVAAAIIGLAILVNYFRKYLPKTAHHHDED